jgi:UDP-glucose 4-epimerase
MEGKKIVVTGGAGFIGSNITRTLARENDVFVIDDLSTGKIENIKDLIYEEKITFLKNSITDIHFLKKSLKNVDYVFHEAAVANVSKSIKDPVSSNNININGTLNVLMAAKENKVKKVIYASSAAVYGEQLKLPISEKSQLNPLSPYAAGKIAGEYYCNVFKEVYNLPTVSLRYFNVYGPYQDPHGEYASVIPKFITFLSKNKSPVIFGDGLQTRDFIFVDDVVNANILAAENDVTGIFNIASGVKISINNLAREIMKIMKKKFDLIYEKPRQGDIRHSLADATKFKKIVNYKIKWEISAGLKETIKWFQR